MAIYAIGDVQGCATALRHLIDQLPWDPRHDRLWFVGDLVNRGPESAEALRLIMALGERAVTVLGNHDLYLLAVAEGVMPIRPKDTIGPILHAPDRSQLLNWVRRQPLMHQEGPYVMVHAGLLPNWSLDEAAAYAREVETALQSTAYRRTLESMFMPSQTEWSTTLTGDARVKGITDVFTRLRICTPGGHIHHQFKGEPKDIPDGYHPWFEVPSRRPPGSTVVFGHWSALGLHLSGSSLGLDSGCVWGRSLTAVRLADRRVFQVPCHSCASPRVSRA